MNWNSTVILTMIQAPQARVRDLGRNDVYGRWGIMMILQLDADTIGSGTHKDAYVATALTAAQWLWGKLLCGVGCCCS